MEGWCGEGPLTEEGSLPLPSGVAGRQLGAEREAEVVLGAQVEEEPWRPTLQLASLGSHHLEKPPWSRGFQGTRRRQKL